MLRGPFRLSWQCVPALHSWFAPDTTGNSDQDAGLPHLRNLRVVTTSMRMPKLSWWRPTAPRGSIAHAASVDIKTIAKQPGHSSIAITADTYAEVFAEVDHAAAESAASVVPLRRRVTCGVARWVAAICPCDC